MTPTITNIIIPWTFEYVILPRKGSAGAIRLRICKWGNYPALPGRPSAITSVLTGGRQKVREGTLCPCFWRWGKVIGVKEGRWAPGAGRAKHDTEPLEGWSPAPSRTIWQQLGVISRWIITYLCVNSTLICSTCIYLFAFYYTVLWTINSLRMGSIDQTDCHTHLGGYLAQAHGDS